MTTVAFELPEEAFSALKRPPAEFARGMRLAAAIHWYTHGEISMEKAAMIAGLDRVDFLAELAAEQVDVFEVSVADLKSELERV